MDGSDTKRALILVDLQYDFMPGGALAVAGGDEVVAVANALQQNYDLVVATQDWHPAEHRSFASQHAGGKVGDVVDLNGLPQVLWPNHCVAGMRGAELVAELDGTRIAAVFRKGLDREVDSYSGFFDNGRRRATGLEGYLRGLGVTHVTVMGLATDYCVKFTALDAATAGFHATLYLPGCRGVELNPGDITRALDAMREAGITIRE